MSMMNRVLNRSKSSSGSLKKKSLSEKDLTGIGRRKRYQSNSEARRSHSVKGGEAGGDKRHRVNEVRPIPSLPILPLADC